MSSAQIVTRQSTGKSKRRRELLGTRELGDSRPGHRLADYHGHVGTTSCGPAPASALVCYPSIVARSSGALSTRLSPSHTTAI